MNFRSPAFNRFGTIDCEIEHPVYGWVPFTVDPADGAAEFDVAALLAEIRSGSIAPYVPPTEDEALAAQRAWMACSRFQLKAALANAGLLSDAESAVLGLGAIAHLAWSEAAEFRRTSPTVIALCEAIGLTEAQIDDLFHAAMVIEA